MESRQGGITQEYKDLNKISWLKVFLWSVVGLISSFLAVTLVVVGAGGFPAKFYFPYVALPTVLMLSLWSFLRPRKIVIGLLFLVFIVLQLLGVSLLFDRNVLEGQIYGEVYLNAIDDYHARTGEYPKNLNLIKSELGEEAEKKIVVSYVVDIDDYVDEVDTLRVGALFLMFNFNEDTSIAPKVSLGRRDTQYLWDWELGSWQ